MKGGTPYSERLQSFDDVFSLDGAGPPSEFRRENRQPRATWGRNRRALSHSYPALLTNRRRLFIRPPPPPPRSYISIEPSICRNSRRPEHRRLRLWRRLGAPRDANPVPHMPWTWRAVAAAAAPLFKSLLSFAGLFLVPAFHAFGE